jgi:hypothetical protein
MQSHFIFLLDDISLEYRLKFHRRGEWIEKRKSKLLPIISGKRRDVLTAGTVSIGSWLSKFSKAKNQNLPLKAGEDPLQRPPARLNPKRLNSQIAEGIPAPVDPIRNLVSH